MAGFRAQKATPYAASQVVKKACEAAVQYGLKDVNVYIKGIGPAARGNPRFKHQWHSGFVY